MSTDAITTAKVALRQTMQRRRSTLTIEQSAAWSRAIAERVLALRELEQATSVFVYVSVGREVATRGLIEALLEQGKRVAVPVVPEAGVIEAHLIAGMADLQPDRYGIPAPTTPRPLADSPDVCIAPAVAVTEQGKRMGMGGGYYDRYLAAHRPGVTIALAYEMQVVDTLPTEPVDQPVDAIATESRVIRCRAAAAR